jgi:hypothetical protein
MLDMNEKLLLPLALGLPPLASGLPPLALRLPLLIHFSAIHCHLMLHSRGAGLS